MHDTFGVKQMYYSNSSLNMYQSRLQLCILKCVSIQIQLSLYSQVCINPDTTLCILKYVSIQIQLYVFSRVYQSRYNSYCILKYVSIQILLSQTLYSTVRVRYSCRRSGSPKMRLLADLISHNHSLPRTYYFRQ